MFVRVLQKSTPFKRTSTDVSVNVNDLNLFQSPVSPQFFNFSSFVENFSTKIKDDKNACFHSLKDFKGSFHPACLAPMCFMTM